jgi:site-specific recombinase XerD
VTLNVPKELQSRLPSKTGTPVKRLQQSTGTDSLALAKKRFPQIMADLQKRLAMAFELLHESEDDRLRRQLGALYLQTADNPQRSQAFKAKASQTISENLQNILQAKPSQDQIDSYVKGFTNDLKALLVEQARNHAAQAGIALDNDQAAAYAAASKRAILGGRTNADSVFTSGLLHQETELGQRLRAEAAKPLPVTLEQALDLKRADLGERTLSNYATQIAAWEEHINASTLSSLSSSSLNSFIRWLASPVAKGGRGMCKDSANNYGLKIRSLIKVYNQHCKQDNQRMALPGFDLLQHSETEKRQKVLKDRERAASDETCMAMQRGMIEIYPELELLIPLYRLAGLRNTEAPFLQWQHIRKDPSGTWMVDLLWSKTADGIRLIPINEKLQSILLPRRGDPDSYVLPSQIHDVKNIKDWIGDRIRNVAKHQKVNGAANAHSYRHAFGGDLSYHCTEEVKQKLMGHKGNLTSHYTSEKMKALATAVEFVGTEIDFRFNKSLTKHS